MGSVVAGISMSLDGFISGPIHFLPRPRPSVGGLDLGGCY
jgi:hypothetical protein